MFDKDSQSQKQQHPYSSYTPYGTSPVAQPGQPVYTPEPQPVAQPGQPVYTPDKVAQPGQTLPVTDKMPGVQVPLWVQHASLPQPGTPVHPSLPPQPKQPKRSRMRAVAIGALICLFALVFGVGIFSGWTFARSLGQTPNSNPRTTTSTPAVNSNSNTLDAAQETAIAKVEPAVVQIQGITGQGVSLGSGIIIDNRGDIVTNNHVVDGTSSLTVLLNNGSQETAQVVGTDPTNDLAVIRIQPFASMTVAILSDSSQLIVGQEVLAIGSPLGYGGSATSGVVSALNRTATESGGVTLNGLIQTSAAINPGNSGGALINLQGQVVGIPTLSAINSETRTPANGIGFAIPSNQIQTSVAKILGN